MRQAHTAPVGKRFVDLTGPGGAVATDVPAMPSPSATDGAVLSPTVFVAEARATRGGSR